ncbi:hypothetical protein C900_05666 [Fulvivirga imtechensis AK7]|uniref:Uncharacterized protein n=1 Tax=Fulvivirga imtechensis AK7 TaxID=1237149 RepID=L8JJ19_9BACT|nr:hypothetical protein C900_05666 [Fulvivirga imtechensis AK7]
MKHLRNLVFFCAIPLVEFVGLLLKKCFSEGSRNRSGNWYEGVLVLFLQF